MTGAESTIVSQEEMASSEKGELSKHSESQELVEILEQPEQASPKSPSEMHRKTEEPSTDSERLCLTLESSNELEKDKGVIGEEEPKVQPAAKTLKRNEGKSGRPNRKEDSKEKEHPFSEPPVHKLPDLGEGSFFSMIECLLKGREQIFRWIREERELPRLSLQFLLLIILCTIPVGMILGSYNNVLQSLFVAIKLPFLLLFPLGLCLSTFWVWGLFFRVELRFAQISSLALASMATTGLLLFALCPMLWLFMDRTNVSYHQAISVVVIVFGLAGVGGMRVLLRGLHRICQVKSTAQLRVKTPLLGLGWVGIYGIVGLQMSWLLRPYLSHPWAKTPAAVFIRSLEGNVFSSVLRTFLTAIGLIG